MWVLFAVRLLGGGGLPSALWYVVHRRQMAGVRIKYTLRGAGFGQSRAEWSVLGADDDAFPSGPVSFVMPILEGGERPGGGGRSVQAACAITKLKVGSRQASPQPIW